MKIASRGAYGVLVKVYSAQMIGLLAFFMIHSVLRSSVHESAAFWHQLVAAIATRRCKCRWMDWPALSSFQRAGCSALGSVMTEWPAAVSDVSDNRCNGLVSLEV